MAKQTATFWGIHAGKTGDADHLFLTHSVIALGWADVGDLSKLSADREAFKARVKDCYPDRKEGYFPVAGGQLFRFVHEAKIGDYVLYPSKQDRTVHMGEIIGPFKYDTKTEPGYPQHRPVKWKPSMPLPLSFAKAEEIARAELKKLVDDSASWEVTELQLKRIPDEDQPIWTIPSLTGTGLEFQRSHTEDQAKWFYLIGMKPREGSSRQKHDSFFVAMNLSGAVGIIEEAYRTR